MEKISMANICLETYSIISAPANTTYRASKATMDIEPIIIDKSSRIMANY